MNDILKYELIAFDYEGKRMSIPMGEIICIQEQGEGVTIHTRGDTWTSDKATYDEIAEQWHLNVLEATQREESRL